MKVWFRRSWRFLQLVNWWSIAEVIEIWKDDFIWPSYINRNLALIVNTSTCAGPERDQPLQKTIEFWRRFTLWLVLLYNCWKLILPNKWAYKLSSSNSKPRFFYFFITKSRLCRHVCLQKFTLIYVTHTCKSHRKQSNNQ